MTEFTFKIECVVADLALRGMESRFVHPGPDDMLMAPEDAVGLVFDITATRLWVDLPVFVRHGVGA